MMALVLVMAACTDNIAVNEPGFEAERFDIGKVMLAAGTTENSVTTRADAKTYYMPAAHRFVAKMYFKTTESGALYDIDRAHTAWLKVDDKGAGNSLYWQNTYPTEPKRVDKYGNDEFAPTFYWQNRKEHAFLAWTDLNRATEWIGVPGPLNFNSNLVNYAFRTGNKEWQWVEKTITVHGESVPFANEKAVVEAYKNTTSTSKGQEEYKKIAKEEVISSGEEYYWWNDDNLENYCKVVVGSDPGEIKGPDKKTSPRHVMYFFKNKLEYTIPAGKTEGDLTIQKLYMEGTEFDYVIDENNTPVARKVIEGGNTKYYQCTPNCHIMYDESLTNDDDYTVYIFRRNLQHENLEVVEDYPALGFDLSKGTKNSMAEQPDIAMALTINQVPKSAVMEANRVHLYFKHQFAQVQVNIKNSVDNSVLIKPEQIEKVELLGVSNYGYVFADMNEDGTVAAPKSNTVQYASSYFKEVVATDYTDQQLEENPYGTSFEMFNRALTTEDTDINKIIKSYECITFGRLQAIRITWKEDDYKDPVTNEDKDGIKHVATYRVPEKNDHNEPLRLLEQGKKYIWNMELRRGTLAVIRTEIIPWEENQEEYNTDGFIVTTPSNS